MRKLHLPYAPLLLLFILTASCRKDSPDNEENSGNEVFEVYEMLTHTGDKYVERLGANGGNPWLAIVETGEWAETQPGVEHAIYEDSVNIFITMTSGLKTRLSYIETDGEGNTLFRGGGNGGRAFTAFAKSGGGAKSGSGCSNIIENKKVLIWAAKYDEFYGSHPDKMQRIVDVFEDAEEGFEVTLLKDELARPEILDNMGDYGLVILETHGFPESFMSGQWLTLEEGTAITSQQEFQTFINAEKGSAYFQWMREGKIVLGHNFKGQPDDPSWWTTAEPLTNRLYSIDVTSRYIEALAEMSETVIMGNMCFSGYGISGICREPISLIYEKPIRTSFLALNPIAYFGYGFDNDASTRVDEDFAKQMEYNLVQRLVIDGDSTGNAHLDPSDELYEIHGEAFDPTFIHCGNLYFKNYGQETYCYGGCGDTLTDARDGKKYATTCIGEQVWMAANLNWAGAGICYDGSAANCETYGRLYTLLETTGQQVSTSTSTVQGICPEGWHVPSEAEFDELIAYCGGADEAANALRSASGWPAPHTDAYGFNLLPSGHFVDDGNNSLYDGLGNNAKLWTSSQEGGYYPALNAYHPNLIVGNFSYPDPIWKFSCRCVKD